MSVATSGQLRDLRAALDDVRSVATSAKGVLREINAVDLRASLESACERAVLVAGETEGALSRSLADDLAAVRSALKRHPLPMTDPELGVRTPSLEHAENAVGALLYRVDIALDRAREAGVVPGFPEELPPGQTLVPRAIHAPDLDRIADTLEGLKHQLDRLDELRDEAGSGRQQAAIIALFVERMNVQIDLARWEATVEKLVDLEALARAISAIGRLTADFVQSVRGMVRTISDGARSLAQDVRQAAGTVVEAGASLFRRFRKAPETPEGPSEDRQFDFGRAIEGLIKGEAPRESDVPFLTAITIHDPRLKDLSAFARLTNLQFLDLSYTSFSDVSALSGLTGLQSLDLAHTSVSDVSALTGLTGLQSLNLSGTKVSDVSALSGLTGLQSLDLSSTRVSDVSALSGLTDLRILNLWRTLVSDVSALSGLTGLQSLNLWNAPVSDVSALSGLTGLESLDLEGTPVSDVSALYGLTALQSLDLSGMSVSDVSVLSRLTGLRSLRLARTSVSDVSALSGLTGLRSLDLSGTSVSDVSALSGLTGLESLILSGTSVSDVSALSGVTGLQSLDLSGTSVSDVSALYGLTGLRSLDLMNTPVSDVSELSDLPDLRIVGLKDPEQD